MKINKYHIRRLVWALLLTGSVAFAGGPEYLGFSLNINTRDDVIKLLKARHSQFNDNYGYRGYGNDLPVIKVTRDPLFNTHGEIDEAWLEFTPEKKLYRISVTWSEAGETYAVIKEIYDDKYHGGKNVGQGFIRKHIYQNGNTKIVLTRNSFGFGRDQKTSVEYIYVPAVKSVEQMKYKIDTYIKSQNIKQKGTNL